MQRQIDHHKGESGRALAQIAVLDDAVAKLQRRNALAKVQIATLQSDVAAYKKGVAVVVWDSEKNQGVLKLEKMPPVEPGKDYQLWVVDPQKPAPVDAGVVRVDEQGFAKIDFKPVDAVVSAEKFALSVEKEGGVPKGEGPIVFIGP
jgi:anti-sigma-K factor RskA